MKKIFCFGELLFPYRLQLMKTWLKPMLMYIGAEANVATSLAGWIEWRGTLTEAAFVIIKIKADSYIADCSTPPFIL